METTKALTLEAGKYYRTRDGRKAIVLGTSPFKSTVEEYAAVGFIEGKRCDTSWHLNGRWGSSEDDRDLIAEWVEPKRIKGWMNIYDGHMPSRHNGMGLNTVAFGAQIYPNRGDADIAAKTGGASLKLLACIYVETVEGAGLGEAA